MKKELQSKKLEKFALDTIADLKGLDPVCMDISKMSSIADHMIVVTGTSSRHVKGCMAEPLPNPYLLYLGLMELEPA